MTRQRTAVCRRLTPDWLLLAIQKHSRNSLRVLGFLITSKTWPPTGPPTQRRKCIYNLSRFQLHSIRYPILVIALDFCCIYIGLVFIKDRPVSSFFGCFVFEIGCFVFEIWVLRFRVLGASFSSFGCFVFEFWVLRASVFVFECFVFETTGLP